MMKRSWRYFVTLSVCVVFLLLNGAQAFACTGVYVGAGASEDGTIMLAKSNDYPDVWANYVAVTERVEGKSGRTMPVDNGATVFAPLPETTCRYTSTPWMDSATERNGLGHDATVCANEYGVTMVMRVIGTDTALSVHIAQIVPSLPADMSCVTWESTGPALYGVFVPISNAVTAISAPYSRNQSAEKAGVFDTEQYPYYRFKELNTLCVERKDYQIYGLPVRAYWHAAEQTMANQMPEILQAAAQMGDTAAAKQYITDYCTAMQEQAFADAGQLLNDVRWYHIQNSNTMKNGLNPETHAVLDELKAIEPLTVTADAAAYQYAPSAAAETQQLCVGLQ